MDYPKKILPQVHFHIISWDDDLLECVLLRTTKDDDFYDRENQRIKADYISPIGRGREDLKDYSTSLLGIFTKKDCQLQLTKDGKEYSYFILPWKQGEKVKAPAFKKDFTTNERMSCFYLPIKEIHDIEVNYQMENNPEFTGTCFVKHTPTNCNFWHFSVRWKNHEGQDISEAEGKWRALLGAARNMIMEVGMPDCPQYKQLPLCHYERKK